ncbi:hypothetical protein E1H99_01135 [Enterococcus hirae]|nr:hypothetical protein E1H99_01135 [Enterococcus hirae]
MFSHLFFSLTTASLLRERLEQKWLTPRNKKKFTKIIFQFFANFSLLSKELLLFPPFIRI